MNNFGGDYDEIYVDRLWTDLDAIVKTNVDKSFSTIIECIDKFAAWHNSLRIDEEQRRQFYHFWGNFLCNTDPHNRWRMHLFHSIFVVANPLIHNQFFQTNADLLMSSFTYLHLYQQNQCKVAKIETDGDWIKRNSIDIDLEAIPSINFGQIVGLDLSISDIKKIPDVTIKCKCGPDVSNSETSAALSFMMLRVETRSLRKLAHDLYPVLKHILHRKLVIDRVIYFLVRDLCRPVGAAFIDCCPGIFRTELQENLFIPLYIPFDQQGYWFNPSFSIETKEKVNLVTWQNRDQKELTTDCKNPWSFQFIEETALATKDGNNVRWRFEWTLFRSCILIQSDKELAKIEFTASNTKTPLFCCLDPKQILVQKNDFYWYNISMLATHDFMEALFSNILYHPTVMHKRFECWTDYIRLSVETIDPMTKIRLYSRILNKLMSDLKIGVSGPMFHD